MATKIFNLSLPPELVAIIDHQAKLYFSSRSEYIKTAIITRLKSEGVEHSLSKLSRTAEELNKQKLELFLNEYKANAEAFNEDEEFPNVGGGGANQQPGAAQYSD